MSYKFIALSFEVKRARAVFIDLQNNYVMGITAYYQSPIGILKITAEDFYIQSIFFTEKDEMQEKDERSEAIELCIKQLDEYFSGNRIEFDFPYQCKGTDFQQKVWSELENIPFGKTTSYKAISQQLGDAKLVRAVGTANGKNPLSIVVPCHRVVGSNGKLVGYAGGLWRKQWLLEHEQKKVGTQPSLFD